MSTLLDSGQVIKNSYDEVNQALKVVSIAGDFSIEFPANSFSHISTNSTTLVKTGPGVLSAISINTAGASSNKATIYDGVSAAGTVIGIIDTTVVRSIPFTAAFTTGLTIVTATGTAADITVTYT